MTLEQQLRELLKNHRALPDDPNAAITGVKLAENLAADIVGDYANHSIRQTLSKLAADATSPIARVEQGFGYYRRSRAEPVAPATQDARRSEIPPVPDSPETADAQEDTEPDSGRDGQLEEKFRAFFIRNSLFEDRFPQHIEHTRGTKRERGVNRWKFPDVIELEWNTVSTSGDTATMQNSMFEVKRGLGEQPFKVISIELKVELSLSNFREAFFQCVSNSMWSHEAKLAVAYPITDSLLAKELRRLGSSYGVHVESYGFPPGKLASMPNASDFKDMSDDDFESLRTNLQLKVDSLTTGTQRPSLDWEHLNDMVHQSIDFRNMVDWIARCLRDVRRYTFESFGELVNLENKRSIIVQNSG